MPLTSQLQRQDKVGKALFDFLCHKEERVGWGCLWLVAPWPSLAMVPRHPIHLHLFHHRSSLTASLLYTQLRLNLQGSMTYMPPGRTLHYTIVLFVGGKEVGRQY